MGVWGAEFRVLGLRVEREGLRIWLTVWKGFRQFSMMQGFGFMAQKFRVLLAVLR